MALKATVGTRADIETALRSFAAARAAAFAPGDVIEIVDPSLPGAYMLGGPSDAELPIGLVLSWSEISGQGEVAVPTVQGAVTVCPIMRMQMRRRTA